jgi:hypothetical protein
MTSRKNGRRTGQQQDARLGEHPRIDEHAKMDKSNEPNQKRTQTTRKTVDLLNESISVMTEQQSMWEMIKSKRNIKPA